jgi:carboxypeptidase Taq
VSDTSANIRSTYKKLLTRAKDLILLQTAEGLIHWDMETMMPPKAVEQRSLQMALLSRLHHKMATARGTGTLLNTVLKHSQYGTLSSIEKRNVRLIKKDYDEQTALPEKLVEETTKQQAVTVNTWKKAKAAKNYAILKPELEKLVSLNRKAAAILMKVKATATPYDALVDAFEPKMTTEAITAVFNKLQKGLTALLEKILNAPNQPDTRLLNVNVPVEAQRQIAKTLTAAIGYDIASPDAAGRIDETEHPFTTGYYDDVRITTHYYPRNFASAVFSTLHEAGHALYEQGLPREWRYQPVGSTCSYGIHESQSRFMENVIGRSRAFWTGFLPKLKTASPALSTLELEPFVHAINKVAPSKIRIEADEVTYCTHIIIRFQIESMLFAGKVEVAELPHVWNQKYKEFIGVNITDDSEGVMQDTHWASGLYGYFPSYALGNIYSGQMLAEICKAIPDWRSQIAAGNLKSVQQWLGANVHCQGDLYDPAELIMRIAGKKLDAEPYLRYLEEKYSGLYGF